MPVDSDPNTTTSRPKYYAVITYVPEEFIWCDWLHRQLDGVTVPPDLADKRTRHGFTRPPVIHVFPDPRNPAHLARHVTSPPPSRHLVVICSPHSVKSPALDEQIRAFKRTEGEDRIVVLVADGDPSHDDAPVGADDAAWLPAWLRWRLDKKGNFRPAEASEPQIIDARADKLEPPEARAHLLAALLDVPREKLSAYGDLLTAGASATLAPAAVEAEAAAAVPVPVQRSSGGLFVIGAIIVAAAAGAWWMSTQPSANSQAIAEATPPVASATSLPSALASTPPPTPAPTPGAATPVKATPAMTPRVAATPKPSPPTPVPVPVTKLATPPPPKSPASPAAPPKKVITAFAPSEGPQTPITNAPASSPMKLEAGSSWQRMRDLGDTLLSRDNRDTGMIALTQAVAIGLRSASSPETTLDERLDIGRLCFRVGALQKQFVNSAEARRTLTSARTLLQQLSISDAGRLAERDSLVADIDQLLRSIR